MRRPTLRRPSSRRSTRSASRRSSSTAREIAESGVIVEYLARKYGGGRFAPAVDIDSDDYLAYLHWMHYAEGSAMVPVCCSCTSAGSATPVRRWRRASRARCSNHFGYMNQALQGREFFVGNALSGADVQMSFVVEAGASRGPVQGYPNLVAFMDRIQARPAYQRALQRGGPYRFAKAR